MCYLGLLRLGECRECKEAEFFLIRVLKLWWGWGKLGVGGAREDSMPMFVN